MAPMSNARVWINGHELGGRLAGYIGFAFDLTPHLKFGAETNVIAVRLTPKDHSLRWYPGAGIYRNVWLDITGPACGALGHVRDDSRGDGAEGVRLREGGASQSKHCGGGQRDTADQHRGRGGQGGYNERKRHDNTGLAARQTVAAVLAVGTPHR